MKAGDLVALKSLHECWGKVALITRVHRTSYGTGQIYVLTAGGFHGTIPWSTRDMYISSVLAHKG